MLIDIIAGARPNFMKITPIIRALQKRRAERWPLRFRLAHTGQHYDARMSGDFFSRLGIPDPDVNLEVGSGTQAEQNASITVCYERLLLDARSDLCPLVGDVASTMACTIAAQKLCVPVAHVEAGIRAGDWSMPEEINRMVSDSIANRFFTTSALANDNLRRSGIGVERIIFVGKTMVDTLLASDDRLRPPSFWKAPGLTVGGYFVLTFNRPANVDSDGGLSRLLAAIGEGTRGLPVVFLVHPRSAKTLRTIADLPTHLQPLDSQPDLEFNYLAKHAKAVITDSGGITEASTVTSVHCLTLRDSTERPETVTVGTNELIGTDPAKLKPALDTLFSGTWRKGAIPEKWDGQVGPRSVAALEHLLDSRKKKL